MSNVIEANPFLDKAGVVWWGNTSNMRGINLLYEPGGLLTSITVEGSYDNVQYDTVQVDIYERVTNHHGKSHLKQLSGSTLNQPGNYYIDSRFFPYVKLSVKTMNSGGKVSTRVEECYDEVIEDRLGYVDDTVTCYGTTLPVAKVVRGDFNVVQGPANSGCMLRQNVEPGKVVYVHNKGSASVKVYAPFGGGFNNVDQGYVLLAAGACAQFFSEGGGYFWEATGKAVVDPLAAMMADDTPAAG